jgi:hypothetical protein
VTRILIGGTAAMLLCIFLAPRFIEWLREDVGARAAVGGGGQRQPRHLRKTVEQRTQQAIVGAEVMPPLAHAMRFVDREQGDVGLVEQLREALLARPLGRDVEQVELARAQGIADRARILAEAGQRGGADAEPLGRADLVVHQRDKRRDNDPGARPGECG